MSRRTPRGPERVNINWASAWRIASAQLVLQVVIVLGFYTLVVVLFGAAVVLGA